MKKNWIIVAVVIVSICTNMVIFLFTQGKVKIDEKIVTIYEESEAREIQMPASSVEPYKMTDSSNDMNQVKRQVRDIGDSNYSGNGEYQAEDNQQIQDAIAKDEVSADEDIPIPQLPLCDRDFEVDVDVGGYEDILLPLLPDES